MVLTPWAIDKEHLKQGEKIGTVSIDTGTVRISVWVQNRDGIDEQQCKEAMDTAHLVSQIPAMIQHLKWCNDAMMEQNITFYESIDMSSKELSDKLNYLINEVTGSQD